MIGRSTRKRKGWVERNPAMEEGLDSSFRRTCSNRWETLVRLQRPSEGGLLVTGLTLVVPVRDRESCSRSKSGHCIGQPV